MPFGSLCHKKNDTIQNTVTQKAVTTLRCLLSFFFFLSVFWFGDLVGVFHKGIK